MNALLKENISYDELEYIKNELNHYLIMQKNTARAYLYIPVSKKMMRFTLDNSSIVIEDNVRLEDAAEQFSYIRIYIRMQDRSPLGNMC